MPKFTVSKSIEIDAPLTKVFETINDFNTWKSWSPWLIMDKKAEVKITDDTKSQEWEGPRTGSGKMKITGEEADKSVDIDLTLLKPWKSQSKVRFETKENNGGTTVTWKMDGSLPFFMFWMKKMMESFIGMDYNRGLMMMKDLIEDGEVHSKMDWKGNENLGAQQYIGIKTATTKDAMGKKMTEDMPKIMEYVEKNGLKMAGVPFTQYHKWDMVKDNIEYISGFPVDSIPADLPAGFVSGEIPATTVYTLEHTGSYKHLGNAWTTLYTMQRGKEFKQNKKIHPFETYHNSPGEVGENELVTKIHFPLK